VTAQLPDRRPSPLSAGGDPAGDPAVFPRERQGRHAVQPRQARDRLSARQGAARQAAVRHPARRLCRRATNGCNHSIAPARPEPFRITIGGPDCTKPYSASVFNISAMSFGALSANAIRALNAAPSSAASPTTPARAASAPITARMAATSSGRSARAISAAATGRHASRPEKFAAGRRRQIKMVEIKLSQGAKPGHGGVLPAAKVSAEIAETRGVPVGEDCISPARTRPFRRRSR
jgi:glutamate synthase domain-containing protein 2